MHLGSNTRPLRVLLGGGAMSSLWEEVFMVRMIQLPLRKFTERRGGKLMRGGPDFDNFLTSGDDHPESNELATSILYNKASGHISDKQASKTLEW
jgi:hypothetical protein